ncbi:hypothetical protein BKA70DRAFT_1268300, partial [Coprinopsis sp. MPI-PUGE-AT-0042]
MPCTTFGGQPSVQTFRSGHLCKTSGCAEVSDPFPLDPATVTELLRNDLTSFQNSITRSVNDSIHLSDNQYGALVSLGRLNACEDPETVIEQELPNWNKAGGKVLPGLVSHRKREVELSKAKGSIQ